MRVASPPGRTACRAVTAGRRARVAPFRLRASPRRRPPQSPSSAENPGPGSGPFAPSGAARRKSGALGTGAGSHSAAPARLRPARRGWAVTGPCGAAALLRWAVRALPPASGGAELRVGRAARAPGRPERAPRPPSARARRTPVLPLTQARAAQPARARAPPQQASARSTPPRSQAPAPPARACRTPARAAPPGGRDSEGGGKAAPRFGAGNLEPIRRVAAGDALLLGFYAPA